MKIFPPKKSAIAALILSILLSGAFSLFKHKYPPTTFAGTSTTDNLQHDANALAQYTPAKADDAERSLKSQVSALWTRKNFEEWRKDLPKGWILSSLGTVDTKHILTERYSLTKPNAKESDWEEIVSLIRNCENHSGISITSISLSVQPISPKQFSQSLIIFAVYFSPDSQPSNPKL
jgi:hypothetical protein